MASFKTTRVGLYRVGANSSKSLTSNLGLHDPVLAQLVRRQYFTEIPASLSRFLELTIQARAPNTIFLPHMLAAYTL